MDSLIVTPLNFGKVCRVCLSENDGMFSIYSELYEDNSEEESPFIYEILLSISSIKVQADDGLPSMICTKCIDSAHNSFNFQKQCNKAQAILDACMIEFQALGEAVTASDPIISQDLSALDHLSANSVLIHQNDDESDFALISTAVGDHPQHDDDSQSSDSALRNCLDATVDIKKEEVDEEDLFMDVKADYLDDNLELVTAPIVEPLEDTMKLESQQIATKKVPAKLIGNEKKKLGFGSNASVVSSMKYYCRLLENGQKVYECNLCEKSYKYSSSLRIHMRNHTQERPYMCNICNKSFKQYGALIYHQRTHTGEQPYVCKLCGKKYKQSGTLTAHMRVHTGARPFLCSICGRGFRQSPDLSYHMRTHTKEKPYMCNVCGKTMSMQCHLVQHMRTHTGERPFKCTECSKAFPSSTRLKRHSIIHTGLKPYTCEVCDKSFNRSSTLRVHAKIHTDERPHVCSVCNKGFIQAHALRAHIVTHSSELSIKQLMV